jgi:hypothetical protein
VLSLGVLVLPTFIGMYILHKDPVWAKRAERAGATIGVIFLIGAVIFGTWFCALYTIL